MNQATPPDSPARQTGRPRVAGVRLLPLMVAVLILVAIFGVTWIDLLGEYQRRNESVKASAHGTARALEQYLHGWENTLKTLPASRCAHRLEPATCREILSSLSDTFPQIVRAEVSDPAGRSVAVVGLSSFPGQRTALAVGGGNEAGALHVRAFPSGQHFPPFLGVTHFIKPGVHGAVGGYLSMWFLRSQLDFFLTGLSSEDAIALVGEEGQVLAASPQVQLPVVARALHTLGKASSGAGGGTFSADGLNFDGHLSEVGEHGWFVLVYHPSLSLSDFFITNQDTTRQSMVLLLVLALCFGVIFWRHYQSLKTVARQQEQLQVLKDREMRARFEGVAQTLAEGIVLCDDQGKAVYYNPAASDLLGLGAENVDERLRQVFGEGWTLWPGQSSRLHECTWTRDDGKIRRMEVSVSCWQENEQPMQAWVLRDITERFEDQNRLVQAQKMEAVGVLAGGIAHDFNNLLAIVLGHGQLIAELADPGSPLEKYAGGINRAVLRAKEIIGQLLDFSRRKPDEPERLCLADLLHETTGLFRSSISRRIEFDVDVRSGEASFLAVPYQIQQIMINLLKNSADAIGEGGGRIGVEGYVACLTPEAARPLGIARGPWLVLAIHDTGGGIDPALGEQIFMPFFTTKEVGRGTGLGLAVVKSLVERHQGVLWLESTPGVGTRFEVYFPMLPVRGERSRWLMNYKDGKLFSL